MMFLFLIAIPALVIFLFKNFKKVGVKKHNHPPGPPGLPLIGNLHQLDKESLHKYLWRLSNKYGPLMSMKLGFSQVVVISSAKITKEAMKTHDIAFSGKPSFLGLQKLSYNGLDVSFSSYGAYWREIRKICVIHLFNTKKVQSFRPIRADEVSRMIDNITKHALSSKLVNLSEIILSLSSSMICRVGFGKRYDEKGDEKTRFHKLLSDAEAVLGDFFVSDFFPIFGWVDKVNGKAARLEKIYNELDLFYQELIEEHLSPTRPKSMDGDILDTLIVLRDQTLSSSLVLNWDNIKAVLMDVFIAGTDTTAAVVVWAMTALMKEPKAMKKLQENIRELVGKKGRVDEDDIQKLPYLKAVIKETLRLYPPAPLLLPRETIEKCYIDGYEIQPKTLVFFNAWAIGRDPECWENPDDFIPERFCSSVTSNDIDIDYKSVEFDMVPFGGGRRGCPGISLGSATVELALANLVYAFDWELPYGMVKEDIDTNTLPGLTMHKKIPLCLVAKVYD